MDVPFCPSDSVGNPSLRTTTSQDAVRTLRYSNVVGLDCYSWWAQWSGDDGPSSQQSWLWPPTGQQRTGASANTDGVRVVGVQQSCCCAIAWPVAFAPSCDRQQRCHHCVGWCRQDSNAETTVVRLLGDMRRRDGPRPSKRGSRDGGDLRRGARGAHMVPPMKLAHPRQPPNTLNIKMELTQRPWRCSLTTLPTKRMAVGSLLLSILPCHHRSNTNSLGREPCRRYLSVLFYPASERLGGGHLLYPGAAERGS